MDDKGSRSIISSKLMSDEGVAVCVKLSGLEGIQPDQVEEGGRESEEAGREGDREGERGMTASFCGHLFRGWYAKRTLF
jgi:hypothetical protein